MTGLVTLGEMLGLLSSPGIGLLRHASTLNLSVGGAESNVAIGVARLGGDACWIGRVGDDPIGDLVVSRLAGERVDVSHVVRDPMTPTALMIKETRTPSVSRVCYYRLDGPGTRLSPDDLPSERIAHAAVLHVTGITPALGRSAEDTVRAAVDIAQAAGVAVSFDVNYRSGLWRPDEARPVLRDLLARADVFFAGDDEAEMLGVTGTPEQQARAIAELGPGESVIKLGARGAVAAFGDEVTTLAACSVQAVDPVGAGDAFVAGYLAERMRGSPPGAALGTAIRCGAFAVQTPGDWEGSPTRTELAHLDAAPGTVLR
ncbi:sugar kinase [Mycolicibacterium sp. YH-1]|uniref:sugar kinase n=1 Tax=Mycolicibacterium sp. YH-1 TaxID=2908837 RepID=UPI001F4C44FA|nr:sugar kinase [Mycolicibacterium sp. YH-1]UNB54452.1 sugar kinase [Mycolicibacterium sp. YH-1]